MLSLDHQDAGHISSALSTAVVDYRKLGYLYDLVEYHVAKATYYVKSLFANRLTQALPFQQG